METNAVATNITYNTADHQDPQTHFTIEMAPKKGRRKRVGSEANIEPQSAASLAHPTARRRTTAGIETTPARLNLTKEQDDFRRKVEKAAKGTPRFLFRFWSSKSGGSARLNTVDKITPRAFLDHKGPIKSFYERSPNRLELLAEAHLRYYQSNRFHTVYSSWSQSLALVLTWARQAVLDGAKNMHISILDTARLDPQNIVLHTHALRDIVGERVIVYEWEYLIFGVISGPAYRAIAYRLFEPSDVLDLPSIPQVPLEHIIREDDSGCKVDMINQIASKYGSELEVPVAAHIMAFAINKSKGAERVLREVVVMKHRRSGHKSMSVMEAERAVVEVDADEEVAEEEVRKATESLAKSDRVPPQAKTMYQRLLGMLPSWLSLNYS